MKHLDNLYKRSLIALSPFVPTFPPPPIFFVFSFASSISIVAVTLLSLLIFDNTSAGTFFFFGASTVCLSLVLYNSADQWMISGGGGDNLISKKLPLFLTFHFFLPFLFSRSLFHLPMLLNNGSLFILNFYFRNF